MTEVLLQSIALRKLKDEERVRWPYTIPVIAQLPQIDLTSPVTFFVGENGSGKSTLLEGIASVARLPVVGSASIDKDVTLRTQRSFGRKLQLTWRLLEHRGFFLRAEDFFGFIKKIEQDRIDTENELRETQEAFRNAGRSDHAISLATGPLRSSLASIEERYRGDADAVSHGQSFLQLFESRLRPHGLYLLDEPESPLSPASQMAFMSLMYDAVENGSQFIIATHSPILLAFPGAQILNFDTVPISNASYGDLDHVNLTRDFLSNPERYLRHIFRRDDES